MSDLQLFALTASGPARLACPAGATDFSVLYHDVTLGVYSVLRTFDHNQFLHLETHLARTVQSMRLLHWDYTLDEAALRQLLHTVCSAFPAPEMRVRIDVLAAPALALGVDSRVLVALMPFTPLPAHYYTQGVAVGFAPDVQRAQPLIKRADFVATRSKAQAGASAFFEQLMVNERDEILEGLSANFYAVRQGVLYTAAGDVLQGVTRTIILNLAAENRIPVQQTPIRRDEIAQLDEAAISSSTRGLLPVVKIGDQRIGAGAPGPITARLRIAYDAYVARNIRPAI